MNSMCVKSQEIHTIGDCQRSSVSFSIIVSQSIIESNFERSCIHVTRAIRLSETTYMS